MFKVIFAVGVNNPPGDVVGKPGPGQRR